jgi:hypothetical protein
VLQQLVSKLSKGVEYILFIEDDTKVNLQNLSKLIKRLEPKERQFLGRGLIVYILVGAFFCVCACVDV